MRLSLDQRRRIIAPPRRIPQRDPGRLSVLVECRTVSEMNQRGKWIKQHKRSVMQHAAIAYALLGKTLPALPARVRLTRYAPKALDGDNLAGAFKAVRDAVAEAYAVDDGGTDLTFEVAQEPGVMKGYHVRIEIESVSRGEAGRTAAGV